MPKQLSSRDPAPRAPARSPETAPSDSRPDERSDDNLPPKLNGSESGRLAEAVLGGDVRAIGRVLTLIDDRNPMLKPVLQRLFKQTGRARVVGITGSAGTGKSSLIASLTSELRARTRKVGILSVDPSSPFSGGALLGDRIRMRDHFLDPGVFIRSLATRGSRGGLSNSACEAVQVLDAAGNDYILVETIGIGQDQVDILSVAHTVVLVVAPESGDEIQAMKAGIMEAVDLLVINKADLPGAEELFVSLHSASADRNLPILKTSTVTNSGIPALLDAIDHALASSGGQERNVEANRRQLLALIEEGLLRRITEKIGSAGLDNWARKIAQRESDPYTAAEAILANLKL